MQRKAEVKPLQLLSQDRKRVRKASGKTRTPAAEGWRSAGCPLVSLHKTPVNTMAGGLALAFAKVQYQHLHLSV